MSITSSFPSFISSSSSHRKPLPLTLRSSSLPSPPPANPGAIVIGGGLAGLSAALHLSSHNTPFLLLEASHSVGGRVKTDHLDGFLLDRGFQIFITAYPEAQKLLNYDSLNLHRFYSGSRIFHNGHFHTVADPLRHFTDSVKSLSNPIGNLLDKLLIGVTRIRVLGKSDEEILFSGEECRTIDLLRGIGFSDSIIERFFRPFFAGIFFDRELETTSRLFDFVFKCLALGDNTLPAKGISAIPEQLASRLPPGSILFDSKVSSIEFDDLGSPAVRLGNGEVMRSELGVILAVDEPEAGRLLAGKAGPVQKNPVRSTTCLYLKTAKDRVPVQDPVLFLNGSGEGIVNNMFFVTNVAPFYGPPGKALVSVSLIGSYEDVCDEELVGRVVEELSGWFGEETVRVWEHLRTYRVGFAQPNQRPPTDLRKNPKIGSGLYICGDYMVSATFDGALVSGRRAAEALLKDIALVRA